MLGEFFLYCYGQVEGSSFKESKVSKGGGKRGNFVAERIVAHDVSLRA